MAQLTWGDLVKSQDDNETIEEAIARIIAQHNNDEEAHLATGQSLQSHKGAQIIDHLANSVVRDKLSFDRFSIDEFFMVLTAWDCSVGVESMGYGDVQIMTTTSLNNEQSMYLIQGEGIEGQANLSQNPIWQIRIKFLHSTNQESYIGQLEHNASVGFGFKVVGTTLYAVYFDTSNVEHTENLGSITASLFYVFSCKVENGTDVKWYVDGVEVFSVDSIDCANSTSIFSITLKTTNTSYKIAHVQAVHFDADYSD